MRLTKVGAFAVGVALVFGACSTTSSPGGGGGGGGTAVKIGIELPMTGGEAPNGVPTANGVQLALQDIKVPGFTVTINQQDDAVNGKHDATQGAKNMATLVNDSQVLFVVGPYNSSVAQAEIPVSNAAGLMQCSPANTAVQLTKPWGSAKPTDLRKTNPDKIAYVRVATTDDNQGSGMADIAYNTIGAKSVYVLDDTQTYGKGLADAFTNTFTKFGGTLLKRDGVSDKTTDFTSYVTTAKGLNPAVVAYGGVTTSGLGLFRKQMAAQGLQTIPFVGGDGIVDGSFATASSFLQIAGDGDTNSYGTVAAIHDIPDAAAFATKYKAKFNTDPGSYSAPGYACTQIFLQALKAVGSGVTDLGQLREKIRAYVADSGNKYDTVLGSFNFDKDGDTSQHVISYYKFDPTKKDWAYFKQRDFTADPVK